MGAEDFKQFTANPVAIGAKIRCDSGAICQIRHQSLKHAFDSIHADHIALLQPRK